MNVADIRRLDTNQSGDVTALDALVVINRLAIIGTSEGELASVRTADDEFSRSDLPGSIEGPQLF